MVIAGIAWGFVQVNHVVDLATKMKEKEKSTGWQIVCFRFVEDVTENVDIDYRWLSLGRGLKYKTKTQRFGCFVRWKEIPWALWYRLDGRFCICYWCNSTAKLNIHNCKIFHPSSGETRNLLILVAGSAVGHGIFHTPYENHNPWLEAE